MKLLFLLGTITFANAACEHVEKKPTIKEYTTAVESGCAFYAFMSYNDFCAQFGKKMPVPLSEKQKILSLLTSAQNLTGLHNFDVGYMNLFTPEEKDMLLANFIEHAMQSKNIHEISSVYRFINKVNPEKVSQLTEHLITNTLQSKSIIEIHAAMEALPNIDIIYDHFFKHLPHADEYIFDVIWNLTDKTLQETVAAYITESATSKEKMEQAYRELKGELGEDHQLVMDLKARLDEIQSSTN